jgi:hypothetical protein
VSTEKRTPETPAGVAQEIRQAEALAAASDGASWPRFYLVTVHERGGGRAPVVLAWLHEPTLEEVRDALAVRRAEATVEWSVPSPERLEQALQSLSMARPAATLGQAFDNLEGRLARDVTGLGRTPECFPGLELHHEGLVISFQIHAGGSR